MRLAGNLLTPLTVLFAIAFTQSVSAQRTVPGVAVEVDGWLFTPAFYNGTIETIVALRVDQNAQGDNIVAMWYVHGANDTWTAWGRPSRNQSKAVGYVKTVLLLGDETDTSWKVAPTPVDPEEFAPEKMANGVFVDDPLAEAIASSSNPRQLLDFLVSIGWGAASNSVIDELECGIVNGPAGLANALIAGLDDSEAGIAALQAATGSNCTNPGGPCKSYKYYGTPQTTCSQGPITITTDSCYTMGACHPYNSYCATYTQTQTRHNAIICTDCTVHVTVQTRTRACNGCIGECDTDVNLSCPVTLPIPGYTPPATPSVNPCPPPNFNCSWPDWPGPDFFSCP